MKRLIVGFVKREEGSILHFTLIVFVAFLAAAGMGADFMRYELYRADLQNSLDRGVLAATAFSQDQDPVDVITEFVQESEKWNGNGLTPVVSAQRFPNDDSWFEGPVNDRSITASATIRVDTHFLRFVGINSLDVNASSNARQTRKPVEVVMVLDISASMSSNDASTGKARIDGLRIAAKDFIDKVLTPDTVDLTSVTLIPFGGSVNPGDFRDFLSMDSPAPVTWTGSSLSSLPQCPQFNVSDFDPANTEVIDRTRHYSITRAFKRYNNFNDEVRWNWCPEDDAGIVLHSNDPDELKARIDSMQLYDGTGIDLGLKWGLHAMSPESRPVVNSLVNSNDIHDNFRNWPNNFADEDTEKYVVFLTDGGITEQFDIRADMYNGTVADLATIEDVFEDEDARIEVMEHIAGHVGPTGLLADYWSQPNDNYFTTNTTDKSQPRDNLIGGGADGANVRFGSTNQKNKNLRVLGTQNTVWGKAQATQNVENVCNFFKQEKADETPYVRVFTIGFNINGLNMDTYAVPATAALTSSNNDRIAFVLDHCATSDNDQFMATSSTLATAFDEIASSINSLRLTN